MIFGGTGKQAQHTGTGRLPEIAAIQKGVFQMKANKWKSKVLAAMLSVSMLASLGVPSAAAKVIKPTSSDTASQTVSKDAAAKKVIKKDSERVGAEEVMQETEEALSSEKGSAAEGMKAYQLGNMQFQAPSGWTPIESDNFTMVLSPFEDESMVMIVMAFDPAKLYGGSDESNSSFYQAYAFGLVSALAEQEGTQSQSEISEALKESIRANGGEVKDLSFIKGTDFPGMKMTVAVNQAEAEITFLCGKKYDVMIMGSWYTDEGAAKVNSITGKITASVRTVK